MVVRRKHEYFTLNVALMIFIIATLSPMVGVLVVVAPHTYRALIT